jgi:hypothetical protein
LTARVELPEPDGIDRDGAWWRTSLGERVYAVDGGVYTPASGDITARSAVEQDALALLAAARWVADSGGAG